MSLPRKARAEGVYYKTRTSSAITAYVTTFTRQRHAKRVNGEARGYALATF